MNAFGWRYGTFNFLQEIKSLELLSNTWLVAGGFLGFLTRPLCPSAMLLLNHEVYMCYKGHVIYNRQCLFSFLAI